MLCDPSCCTLDRIAPACSCLSGLAAPVRVHVCHALVASVLHTALYICSSHGPRVSLRVIVLHTMCCIPMCCAHCCTVDPCLKWSAKTFIVNAVLTRVPPTASLYVTDPSCTSSTASFGSYGVGHCSGTTLSWAADSFKGMF